MHLVITRSENAASGLQEVVAAPLQVPIRPARRIVAASGWDQPRSEKT
jgi:hypothetical protein